MAKPGVLPLGELPRARLNSRDRLRERKSAFEMVNGFLIAERLSRGAAQGRSRQESADFLKQAVGKHLFNAEVDPLVKPGARRREPEDILRALLRRQRHLLLKLRE